MSDGFRPPVTLVGERLELVPLERAHGPALLEASGDPEVGRFLVTPPARTLPELEAQIDVLLARQREGTDLPFCQLLRTTRRPVGMTRYLHIDRTDRSVEIGGTWLDRAWWRTPLNTESKYLLLRHAFETEGFHRVWLQTDLRNDRSQRAIERLGAVREGVHREDRLLPNGRFRTSVVYAVVADEWPRVRARLEERLRRPWSAEPSAASARQGAPDR